MTTDAARLSGQTPHVERSSAWTRLRRRNWFPYLMTLPAVLIVLAVVVYPMAYALFVSFTPFHLLRPETTSAFVPAEMFDNYARLARDDVFWKAVVNTVIFMAVTVNVSLFIGFGLAMILARMTYATGPARTLLMIPMMFAPVLIGFQFAWFFNATVGLVNNALLSVGLISEPIPFLVDEPTGLISLMLATIWMTVPVVTIVLLAGRLSLSEELYDAASVDGASVAQRLRHITVPQMRPFFVIVLVLLSLDLARAYDIVRIMTDGGPAHRTELIWTYAGQLAIRGSQFGLASAMSMAGVVLGVAFTFYLFRQMMQLRGTCDDGAGTGRASASRTTRRRIHWRDIGANWLAYTILVLAALPAIWILFTAFRPNSEINAAPPVWIPQQITFEAFESLFGLNPEIAAGVPVMSYLTNSIAVALLATAISVPIGTAAGYAFSRFDFVGSRMLLLLLLLTRAVPGIALSLPLFLLMRNFGLIDTIHGLALVYVALNIPFTAWLMDGFFRRIPRELDDAAFVDGASHWQTFWRIDLPLRSQGSGPRRCSRSSRPGTSTRSRASSRGRRRPRPSRSACSTSRANSRSTGAAWPRCRCS